MTTNETRTNDDATTRTNDAPTTKRRSTPRTTTAKTINAAELAKRYKTDAKNFRRVARANREAFVKHMVNPPKAPTDKLSHVYRDNATTRAMFDKAFKAK